MKHCQPPAVYPDQGNPQLAYPPPYTQYPPPGQPGYPPGLPGSHPGQPRYPPGQPMYPPGQPGYPPGQPMYPPGQPRYPPGQPMYPPGQPWYPPGQPMYPPGQPGYPPGQPGYPQGQPGYPHGAYVQGPYGQSTTAVVVTQPTGATMVGAQSPPSDNLLLSVITCLCCFFPTGIFAIMYSCQAKNANKVHDYASAMRYAARAKKLAIVSIIIGIVITIVSVPMPFVA
ncbi:hypothetical protein ACOMHN_064853 [Nucella lapillus]